MLKRIDKLKFIHIYARFLILKLLQTIENVRKLKLFTLVINSTHKKRKYQNVALF